MRFCGFRFPVFWLGVDGWWLVVGGRVNEREREKRASVREREREKERVRERERRERERERERERDGKMERIVFLFF